MEIWQYITILLFLSSVFIVIMAFKTIKQTKNTNRIYERSKEERNA